jgi:ABC-type multidrug transport system ATPase subunit
MIEQAKHTALGRLTAGDGRRVQLSWHDLSYTVKLNKRARKAAGKASGRTGGEAPTTKTILDGLCGHAAPASMLAIMGSSGSGKTTALRMLSFRTDHPGEMTGTLKVNGEELSASDQAAFSRKVAYVMQDDLMLETQTPRETIAFSAALRLPASIGRAEHKALVDTIIQVLRLERCADTLIGNSATGGISGGERKRVSIGCEMVTNPAVILLDEPTSGLDAYTALSVMMTLNDVARAGRTIITTIHQPASEIFDTFNSLLLLHQGRDAFFGAAKDAISHFEQLGVVCPPQVRGGRSRRPHTLRSPADRLAFNVASPSCPPLTLIAHRPPHPVRSTTLPISWSTN